MLRLTPSPIVKRNGNSAPDRGIMVETAKMTVWTRVLSSLNRLPRSWALIDDELCAFLNV